MLLDAEVISWEGSPIYIAGNLKTKTAFVECSRDLMYIHNSPADRRGKVSV